MNAVLIALLLAAAPTEYEFVFGRGSVTVTKQACTAPAVASRIKPEFLPRFLAGKLIFDGKPVAFCWTPDDNNPGYIVIIDEHGETASLPIKAFRPKGVQV